MTDITTRELKGISARNLIALLTAVIFIEFTILMSYNSITNNQKESTEKIMTLQSNVDKLNEENIDLRTRLTLIESKESKQ